MAADGEPAADAEEARGALPFEPEDEPPLHAVSDEEREAQAGTAAVADAAPFECPHCGEPNRPKAHRCRACARPLRALVGEEERAEAARFRRRVRLAVSASVAGAGALLLAIGFIMGRGGAPGAPEKIRWSTVGWAEVDRKFAAPSGGAPADAAEWARAYAARWVRWEGRIVAVERPGLLGGGAALLVRHRSGEGGADVRVDIADPTDLEKPNVAQGATVLYGGKLPDAPPSKRPVRLAHGRIFTARR